MTELIEFDEYQIGIDRICRTRFDLITSFHDSLFRENQSMPPDLDKYIPSLMLCGAHKKVEVAPSIIKIGSQSIQRDVFGNEWARSIVPRLRTFQAVTPDSALEARAPDAYVEASENGYHLSLFEGVIHTPHGPKLTSYAKYIAPMRLPNGVTLYAVAGVLRDLRLQ